MIQTVSTLTPAQSLLFWMLVAVIGLLLLLLTVDIAKLIAKMKKVWLQGDTLGAIRDLVKAHSQVNEYTIRKTKDIGTKAEEVKQVVEAVAAVAAKLTADAPSGLSIPAVVRVPGLQGDRP